MFRCVVFECGVKKLHTNVSVLQSNSAFVFGLPQRPHVITFTLPKGKDRKQEPAMKKVEDYIITIPDFPQPGIMFRDITGVLEDADGLKLAVDELVKLLDGLEFDAIAGAESRGFILGMPISYLLHKPFIPVRKAGKLPRETVSESYDLEYGKATIEIHKSSIKPGDRIVLVDDLVATGGTLKAATKLIEKLGGEVVRIICLLELKGLNGREVLEGYDFKSLIAYEGK